MLISETSIPQVLRVDTKTIRDERGSFVKVFSGELFGQKQAVRKFEEIFFSVSKKDVLRGFHFQTPPFALEKLVWVAQGEILDVVLDLRKDSPTFGQTYSTVLDASSSTALYMPEGTAHAFLCLSSECYVVYATSRVFSPDHDKGVRWDSVGFDWPIERPILSAKDKELPSLRQWESPF